MQQVSASNREASFVEIGHVCLRNSANLFYIIRKIVFWLTVRLFYYPGKSLFFKVRSEKWRWLDRDVEASI